MKCKLIEFDGCFAFEVEAETMAEAAGLVRFGTNRTQVRTVNVSAYGDTFSGSVVFSKHKHALSSLVKRK